MNTYSSSLSALVVADGKSRDSQNAFAPLALAAIVKGTMTTDTLLADLCREANVLSSKGKANANALKLAGFYGVKSVYDNINRIFAVRGNASNYDTIEGVRLAVHGFIGHMEAEHWAEYREMFRSDSNIRKAREALRTAHADGDPLALNKTRRAFRKTALAFRSAYLDVLYPGRPTSFAAMNTAVTTAINAAHKLDKAENVVGDDPQAEGAGDALAIVENATNIGAALDALASMIDHMKPEGVAKYQDKMAALQQAIVAATHRWTDSIALAA